MNNTVENKKRMCEQDVAKGIAMLFVVLCHAMPAPKTVDIVIRASFGFIMPFFFLISGYNYRYKENETYKSRIKKRSALITEMIKFSVIMLVLVILIDIYQGKANEIVNSIKSFFGLWISDPLSGIIGIPTIGTFLGNNRIFEPYWFILYLFTSNIVFFAVVNHALKNKKNFIIINIILISISTVFNIFNIKLPWGFHNAFAIASIMLMGALFGKYELFNFPLDKNDKKHWILLVVSFVIVFTLGVLFPRAGQISGSGQMNKILGPIEVVYTVFYSMISSYFFISFAKIINRIPYVNKFLILLGKNSLFILLIHLPVMYIGKIIMSASLNTELGYVDYFDWRNAIAYVITIILLAVICQVTKKIKERLASSTKALKS